MVLQMAIKNYTSSVSVYQSLGEIQGALAAHGARKVMVDYAQDGTPVGITFGLEGPRGPIAFSLPANIEGVEQSFLRSKIKADKAQAQRTAWRNIRDWVLAQMAFMESGAVEFDEVFLPYLIGKEGKTLYQAYKAGNLLGAGKSSDL